MKLNGNYLLLNQVHVNDSDAKRESVLRRYTYNTQRERESGREMLNILTQDTKFRLVKHCSIYIISYITTARTKLVLQIDVYILRITT